MWNAFRKNFLSLRMCGNNLKGIGGPGAPHTFVFERFRDTGGLVVEVGSVSLSSLTKFV